MLLKVVDQVIVAYILGLDAAAETGYINENPNDWFVYNGATPVRPIECYNYVSGQLQLRTDADEIEDNIIQEALRMTCGNQNGGGVSIEAIKLLLEGYVKKCELEQRLSNLNVDTAGLVTQDQLTALMSKTLTTDNFSTILVEAGYVSGSALTNILSGYVTNTSLATKLGDYVKTQDFTSTLNNYVTGTQLNDVVSGTLTTATLQAALQDYYTKSEIDNKLSGMVTGTALTQALGSYVSSSDLSGALNGYITKTYADSTYATKQELSDVAAGGQVDLSGYVTDTELQQALSGVVSGDNLTVTLNEYVTNTEMQQALTDAITTSDQVDLGQIQ